MPLRSPTHHHVVGLHIAVHALQNVAVVALHIRHSHCQVAPRQRGCALLAAKAGRHILPLSLHIVLVSLCCLQAVCLDQFYVCLSVASIRGK